METITYNDKRIRADADDNRQNREAKEDQGN